MTPKRREFGAQIRELDGTWGGQLQGRGRSH